MRVLHSRLRIASYLYRNENVRGFVTMKVSINGKETGATMRATYLKFNQFRPQLLERVSVIVRHVELVRREFVVEDRQQFRGAV